MDSKKRSNTQLTGYCRKASTILSIPESLLAITLFLLLFCYETCYKKPDFL
jgi:hypothetical protein